MAKPSPIFAKLDPSVVDEELARLPATPRRRRPDDDVRTAHPDRRAGMTSRPPAPEPLPHPVVDNHCHLDIARRRRVGSTTVGGDRAARRAVGRRRGSCRSAATCPAPAGRSRRRREHRRAASAGVALHPNEAPRLAGDGVLDEALAEIERLAGTRGCGPSARRGSTTSAPAPEGVAAQQESFRRHIDLAKRLDRTLMIHDRDAHEDVLRVLDEEGAPERSVMHCFSGDAAMARACLDAGLLPVVRRHRDVQERPGRCATRWPSPRWTGCWSRPTRPT